MSSLSRNTSQLRSLCAELLSEGRVRWEEQISLKTLTTFRTGGPARLVLSPADPLSCARLIGLLQEDHPLILGRGSNVLAPDEGLFRPVIRTQEMDAMSVSGTTVRVQAGLSVTRLAAELQKLGLGGGEFLYGIPGSLGGAVRMNAGAYDHAMNEIVTAVTVCDKTGKIYTLSAEEAAFSYRHSRFFQSGETVLEAQLSLTEKNADQIRQTMEELMERRRSKQPLEYPSAGSYFKRPPGHFAGKLIEDCGLKGTGIGGAQVSEKHAGFLINRQNASTQDVLALEDHVRRTVEATFGITLECEVEKPQDREKNQ